MESAVSSGVRGRFFLFAASQCKVITCTIVYNSSLNLYEFWHLECMFTCGAVWLSWGSNKHTTQPVNADVWGFELLCLVIFTVFVCVPVLTQMDRLQYTVATPVVSPVCSPLSTRGRPTTLVPLMGAVTDSSGAPPPLTLRQTRNILSVQRRMVSWLVEYYYWWELCGNLKSWHRKNSCCYIKTLLGLCLIAVQKDQQWWVFL